MICNHNDCFTCPYEDCISKVEVEPERKKRGRKKLPPEEKAKHRQAYNKKYYEKTKAERHNIYMAKTEGVVQKRYRVKTKNLPPSTGLNINCDNLVTQ